MPEVWYPGAVRIDGDHANYQAGRITVTTGLCHYTVGRNSRGTCGRDFQFLQERDGTLVQGAPIDARCWGAGDPWNGCAVHYEVEYLPGVDVDVFTEPARVKTRDFVHWLNAQWGVPLDHWGGARIAAWTGWIDHGSVIQTGDYHTDGWPQPDCNFIFDTQPTPPVEDFDMSILFQTPTSLTVLNPPLVTDVAPGEVGPLNALVSAGAMKLVAGSDGDLAQYRALYARFLSTLPKTGGGSGGGATAAQVADEFSARLKA